MRTGKEQARQSRAETKALVWHILDTYKVRKKVCEEERGMKYNDRASVIQIILFRGKALELILSVFRSPRGFKH